MSAPKDLRELYTKAKADVGHPEKLLEWQFLHARACGRVIAAEKRLARMEQTADRCNMRLMYSLADFQKQPVLEVMPPPQDMERATLEVAEAIEWRTACEHVIESLRRGGGLVALPGGKAVASGGA